MDQNVFEFSFQRKNQASNIQTTGVVICEETINIDPQVLFQRLIAIKDHHDYSSELFEYEPCGYPPSTVWQIGVTKGGKQATNSSCSVGGN